MSESIAVLATGMLAFAFGYGSLEMIVSQGVVTAAIAAFKVWMILR